MLIWVKMSLFPRAQGIPVELVAAVTQKYANGTLD